MKFIQLQFIVMIPIIIFSYIGGIIIAKLVLSMFWTILIGVGLVVCLVIIFTFIAHLLADDKREKKCSQNLKKY